MTKSNTLLLGYDLDMWRSYGEKIPVTTDISPATNSHILVCGMSGSGKSYYEQWLFKNLISADPESEFYFSDYKGDDSFAYLRSCKNYKSYKNTLENLDIVYERLNDRLSGTDETRQPVTLIWDEYMANILSLINEDKKQATEIMNRVSETLLLGRSISVRLITSMQRPDSLAFPAGSRLNYGIVIILGAAIRSIYEMLIPDFREQVEGKQFSRGEGILLLQGSDLRFIKCPAVRDMAKVQQICKNALS